MITKAVAIELDHTAATAGHGIGEGAIGARVARCAEVAAAAGELGAADTVSGGENNTAVEAVKRIGEDAEWTGRSRLTLFALGARVGRGADAAGIGLHEALAVTVQQVGKGAAWTRCAGQAFRAVGAGRIPETAATAVEVDNAKTGAGCRSGVLTIAAGKVRFADGS